MKPSSSTTTCAHTVIDNSESYMFVSSDIAGDIDLEEQNSNSRGYVEIDVNSKIKRLQLSSLELIESVYLICVVDKDSIENFIEKLLTGENVKVRILGRQFNSQVIKLESDRCYLRAVR